MTIHSWAPGRVNLIGEHTDYTGGLVLPMAIQLGTAVHGESLDGRIRLSSVGVAGQVDLALPISDPTAVEPEWGRYVAGVAASFPDAKGIDGAVSSTVPAGAGLSSSAALEIAVALALGAGEHHTPVEIAQLAQRAEHAATGMPCGVMDQLASACGIEGHALRIDCQTLELTPVAIPDSVRVVVIHSGEHRRLVGSAYADRRAQCEAAAALVGPLRAATMTAVESIEDDVLRHRARHVVSENARVDQFARALADEDLGSAGRVMLESHQSLRDDFEVSTDGLDALVAHLAGVEGVYGARLTGAGFGGCVVALCRPDIDPTPPSLDGWVVSASTGAHLR